MGLAISGKDGANRVGGVLHNRGIPPLFRFRVSAKEDIAIKPDARVNEQIRVREVLLIREDGSQVGVIPTEEALAMAKEAELDLVEVAPDAKPPVCRIYDYKKVLFEQKRRQKLAKKKARASELKEVKMRVRIDPHDRDTKLKRARKFLEQGDKVKFTLQFRGREVTKPQLGTALVEAITEELKDIAEIEKPAQRQDRFIHMIVNRRKDWKPTGPPTEAPDEDEDEKDD